MLVVLAANTYLYAAWVDPADATQTVWQAVLIITALTLAQGAILCLPLDVANKSNSLDCTGCVARAHPTALCCGSLRPSPKEEEEEKE